jgi:drug/metabolite transporter (DMT)-like permease
MNIPILAKLSSESLLSLYPVFVKLINLPLNIQIWSRSFIYSIISIFFVNWSFIQKYLFSKNGLLLSFMTLIHVYTSYRGFQLLDSGVGYVTFYIYPLLILIIAGEKINWPIMIFVLIGVYLLSNRDNIKKEKKEELKKQIESNNDIKENFWAPHPDEAIIISGEAYWNEGIIMMLCAGLSEALIYFLIRSLETKNNWNHIFISYALCAVVFTIYFKNDIQKITLTSNISISLFINAFIGLFGYLLRFYSITHLPTTLYAMLSYFGIFMAYVYGVFINGDVITLKQIIGTICILIPNIYFLIN